MRFLGLQKFTATRESLQAAMEDDEVPEGMDPQVADMMISGFGKKSKEVDIEAQMERARRPLPVKQKESVQKDDDSDADSDSDDDDSDEEDEFPISHELVVNTHEKAVTTATLDTSGSRLVTGGIDCQLKFHDFAAMTPSTVRAFKAVDPTATKTSVDVETHPIHQVAFNPISPASMFVITALPQIKLFSRDGEQMATTPKGDMYLRDMHNTKGHISEVTCGAWHPSDASSFVSAGTDSTLRIWDVNNMTKQKEVIVHKSKAAGSGGRSRMTAVAWGSQAQGGSNMIVTAAQDGSLVLYSGDGPFTRPSSTIADAHTPDTSTTSVAISPDGRTVASRGGDDTVKLWDLRSFKAPISTASHPSTTQYPTSTIRFSPTGGNLLLGSPTGDLHILNSATLRAEHVTPVTPGSTLISATWHARLNQVITTSANGATHVLFSPAKSTNGAALVLRTAPKTRHLDDDPSLTIAPSALEAYNPAPRSKGAPKTGLTASGRSRDPRRPAVKMETPFAGSQPTREYVDQTFSMSRMREEDPRAALLKYKDRTGVFTKAWERNQPVPVFRDGADADDGEDEGEGGPERKKARR